MLNKNMNNITKIKGLSFGSINFSGKIVNPKREWFIIIIFSIVLILISVGFDAYMYTQIVSGEMYVSVKRSDLTIENLKTGALQNILNDFENKKAIIKTLKIGNLVDPSI
jgi:hypothetical protein